MASTQPPVYWVTCAVVRAEKREVPEANQSHSPTFKVKIKGNYTFPPPPRMSSWTALRQICLYQVLIAKYHPHHFPFCISVGQSLGAEIGVVLVALFRERSIDKWKVKLKFHPRIDHEDPKGEYRYSSTLSLILVLDGAGGQRHVPAALPPVYSRYPLNRRLGGPQGRSEQVWKISPPPGFDPRTIQVVARRYTDWAIPAPLDKVMPSQNILQRGNIAFKFPNEWQ